MGYTQYYKLTDQNGKEILNMRSAPCFGSLFSMGNKGLIGKDYILEIYHHTYKNYERLGTAGVRNWFTPLERTRYLNEVARFTGLSFTESVQTDYPGMWADTPYVSVDVLTLKIKEAVTFVQLKAAVTASRYLIEEPYSNHLRTSLDQYDEGVCTDFFMLLQDAFYKSTRKEGEHSLFPGGYFWGLFKGSTYLEYLLDTKPINQFGEMNTIHQKLFQSKSKELAQVWCKKNLKKCNNEGEYEHAVQHCSIPFNELTVI